MKKILNLLLCVVGIMVASSCDNPLSNSAKSTGGTSELLIITESPQQWEGAVGDTLRSVFGAYLEAMPQPEPRYDILNASVKKFENNPLYATHSLILVLKTDSTLSEPMVDITRNKWATPQIIITMKANSDSSLIASVGKYAEAILELFQKNQFERTLNLFNMSPNREVSQTIQKEFNINMIIPGSFHVAIHKNNFLWLRQSAHRKKQDTELGIIVYSQNYSDTAQFNMKSVLARRDSIGFEYIKGPTDGSFMQTSVDVIPPVRNVVESKETGYTVITKGLWMIKKDFMGGPFVNYTLYDKANNRMITAEGYVYNPNGEKRNYMIQMEAILQSIRWNNLNEENVNN